MSADDQLAAHLKVAEEKRAGGQQPGGGRGRPQHRLPTGMLGAPGGAEQEVTSARKGAKGHGDPAARGAAGVFTSVPDAIVIDMTVDDTSSEDPLTQKKGGPKPRWRVPLGARSHRKSRASQFDRDTLTRQSGGCSQA